MLSLEPPELISVPAQLSLSLRAMDGAGLPLGPIAFFGDLNARIGVRRTSELPRLPVVSVQGARCGMRLKKGGVGRKTDVVASFITAFSSEPGSFDGACIKYAMHDWTFRLSYFDERWFRALYQCVEYYSGTRYYGSDMQREADEPGFAARLPARHPVLTMAREKPNIVEGEYEEAKEAHRVTGLRVADLGSKCRLDCTYADGSSRNEILPGYIVMNLCGYMKACVDLHGFIAVPPSGSA
ncbi:MAG: hypothetical protein DI595_03665 [Agrobacterium fabrum]|uniref:Uncharacterized protein n=1 Tax=Agrobacterium fabrum TaxID=1176649 RepID=A0A2W5FBC2_9HYPH|nr:MAG: hypothetical protein DI595_03665 [Agrobacterium fabrum]